MVSAGHIGSHWRRRDASQSVIKWKKRLRVREVRAELLRQVHLINVATGNIVLRTAHPLHELFPAQIAAPRPWNFQ